MSELQITSFVEGFNGVVDPELAYPVSLYDLNCTIDGQHYALRDVNFKAQAGNQPIELRLVGMPRTLSQPPAVNEQPVNNTGFLDLTVELDAPELHGLSPEALAEHKLTGFDVSVALNSQQVRCHSLELETKNGSVYANLGFVVGRLTLTSKPFLGTIEAPVEPTPEVTVKE